MGKPYEIRLINNKPHKLCRGPCHTQPTWIPTTQFRRRLTSGERLRGCCNRCEHYYRYPTVPPEQSGWVLMSNYHWLVRELENRLGRIEAARRAGISKTTWYRWVRGKNVRIQRAKAIRLLTTLHEIKQAGVSRDRASIKRGAYRRGEEERKPYDAAA